MSRCSVLVSMLCGRPFAQAPQMIVGGGLLQIPHAVLLRQQRAGRMQVAHHEHARRQMQIVQQVLMHVRDFLQALRREAQPLLDLLGGDLAQALVQDVADVLEVDREGEDVRAAPGVGLAQALLAADRGQMQLDGVVQRVERVVHGGSLASSLRSSFCSASRNVRSMASTMSTMRSTSRAASASARLGVPSTAGLMYCGLPGSLEDGAAGRSLRAQPGQRVQQADEHRRRAPD